MHSRYGCDVVYNSRPHWKVDSYYSNFINAKRTFCLAGGGFIWGCFVLGVASLVLVVARTTCVAHTARASLNKTTSHGRRISYYCVSCDHAYRHGYLSHLRHRELVCLAIDECILIRFRLLFIISTTRSLDLIFQQGM